VVAKTSAALFALSLLVYGAACAEIAVGHHLLHRGWIVVGVRYLLLLPALVVFLRSHSHTQASEQRLLLPPAGVLIAGFLVVALFLSWQTKQGITISDESAYRFQARIFSVGRLWADPLPGAQESGVPAAV